MSDNVTRLKQLLFDHESATLADLSRKLELLQEDRVEANRRFDAVFKRAGTDERLRKSVATILDGALRDADVAKHDELASSLAPAVVKTVQTEIRNSRDDIAEALYPMTGQMVKAYIASAMKDLAETLNRKLDNNAVMLRLRSISTGRPVSDLLLADSQRVDLDELFLIRRGTGELLARWPANDVGHNQDQMMSGVLTAINDFASEALKDERSSLREIDLGDRQVYLRASPTYLLAAKCSGSGSAAIEKVFDDAFLSAIDQIHKLSENSQLDQGPETKARLLALLAGDLQEDLHAAHDAVSDAVENSKSPLSMLGWLVGIPLSLWLCWAVYENYWRARVSDVANQIVISSSQLEGYPTNVEVSSLGREVALSGLAPTPYAKTSLVNRLKLALPGTQIQARALAVVPSGDDVADQINAIKEDVGKLRPEITAVDQGLRGVSRQITIANIRQNLADAQRALGTVTAELPLLKDNVTAQTEQVLVARLQETSSMAARELADLSGKVLGANAQSADLADLSDHMTRVENSIQRRVAEIATLLINPDAPRAPVDRPPNTTGDAGIAADDLAAASAHLATVTVAVSQLAALKARLPKPEPPPPPYEPSARDQLEAFAKRNAVFFGAGTNFRNRRQTKLVLDGLAERLLKTKAVVRVVGYTDEKGSSDQNTPLSERRADKVKRELLRRGVPSRQLVAFGRKDARDISADVGTRSPNRRVEFEVGFDFEFTK